MREEVKEEAGVHPRTIMHWSWLPCKPTLRCFRPACWAPCSNGARPQPTRPPRLSRRMHIRLPRHPPACCLPVAAARVAAHCGAPAAAAGMATQECHATVAATAWATELRARPMASVAGRQAAGWNAACGTAAPAHCGRRTCLAAARQGGASSRRRYQAGIVPVPAQTRPVRHMFRVEVQHKHIPHLALPSGTPATCRATSMPFPSPTCPSQLLCCRRRHRPPRVHNSDASRGACCPPPAAPQAPPSPPLQGHQRPLPAAATCAMSHLSRATAT